MTTKSASLWKETLLPILLLLVAAIGLFDAFYLTKEHFSGVIPPCSISFFADCGSVLRSPYATPFGIPLALIGLIHYAIEFFVLLAALVTNKRIVIRTLFFLTAVGAVASMYFVFLQVAIIQALCLYCMLSALASFVLYFLVRMYFSAEYKLFGIDKLKNQYKYFFKPLLFALPPEFVHENALFMGNLSSKLPFVKSYLSFFFRHDVPSVKQTVSKMQFRHPVGLSAGYDYHADLPDVLPSIGFGFASLGTFSRYASEGNPSPRLGRLPKSQSLMVNKGFRNPGIEKLVKKLAGKEFEIPIGISIGVTNNPEIKTIEQAQEDLISAFKIAQTGNLKHSYYELNISCPNLRTKVSLYDPAPLKQILTAVTKLKLTKPLFIKMPIDRSDAEFKAMLKVIVSFPVTGVIIGNLQKNRKDPALDQTEVAQWKKGNFSGKPTFKRSNELIALTYKTYGKKLVIIGCGGVFSAEDAYIKIKNGASLVQLITGMIFQGPQLMAEISLGLAALLKKDGYKNIAAAVGTDIK
ncbi:MAG: quinone-dependent dihydroorotate dehydrogenase [Weeksellaceae bacterium]